MKKAVLPLVEFALLVLFFIIIPMVLFIEAFSGTSVVTVPEETTTRTWVGFGLIVGIILVFVVVKRFIINPKIEGLAVRIGVLKDKADTESDIDTRIKCFRKMALLKNFQTVINMIIPVLLVALVVVLCSGLNNFIAVVCTDLQDAKDYIGRINRTVLYASASFIVGVIVQLIFPHIRLNFEKKSKEN